MCERNKDEHFEIFREDGSLVIKDLATNRIVQSPDIIGNSIAFLPDKSFVGKRGYIAYLAVSTIVVISSIMVGVRGATMLDIGQITLGALFLLMGYSTVQILLHEFAHYSVFRMMGRRPDKVGFKLNYYVFPAFYVRMNDCHLLARRDRYVVHAAGVFINAIVTLIAFGILRLSDGGQQWLLLFFGMRSPWHITVFRF